MEENCDIMFRSVQSGAIRTLFEALKEVLVDVNITFDEEGMKIMALDPSRVAVIHLKLVSKSFIHYECNKPRKIGVNLSSLYKLIKLSGNNDVLTMFIESASSSYEPKLHIIIENKNTNTKIHSKLKLIDIDEDILEIPDVDVDSVITMPSSYFQKICRDLSVISDTLNIKSEGNVFTMSAKGDIGETSVVLGGSQTETGVVFSKEAEKIEGNYDIKYLNLFTKSTSLCGQIELYLKQDYPIVLLYSVANLGSLKYVLSPSLNE
jgi:proliferating cell nuclear antigen